MLAVLNGGMETYWRAAALGGFVTAGGGGLAYASTLTDAPSTGTGVGFLVAAALLLIAYATGSRQTLLGAGWAVPAFAGGLVLAVPDTAALQQVAGLLAMLGLGTAIAWPVVNRGLAITNRFGERFWRAPANRNQQDDATDDQFSLEEWRRDEP